MTTHKYQSTRILLALGIITVVFTFVFSLSHFQTQAHPIRNTSALSNQLVKVSELPSFPAPGHFETHLLPQGELYISTTGELLIRGCSDIFLSDDQGEAWRKFPDDVYWACNTELALSPAFSQDGTIFRGLAYGNDAFLYSIDYGETWNLPNTPVIGPVEDIDVSPSYAQDMTLFLVTSDYDNIILRRSTDGGVNFSALPLPSGTTKIDQLVLSPNFPVDQTIFAELIDNTVWRSSDAGQSWEYIDYSNFEDTPDLYDIEAIFIEGQAVVFIISDQGIWHSPVQENTWSWLALPEPDLTVSQFSIAYLPSLAELEIWIDEYGYESRIFHSIDSGYSWETVSFPYGVADLKFSPNYVQDQTFYAKSSSELWKTENLGANWQLISYSPRVLESCLSSDYDQLELVKSPDFAEFTHLFAYPADVSVGSYPLSSSSWFLRSLDNGENWEILPLPECGAPVNIVVSPSYTSTQTIFAGVDSNLFRSDDAGDTWNLVAGEVPFRFEFIDISPSFASDQTIYAGAYNYGVYLSEDGGISWTHLSRFGTFIYGIQYSPTYEQDQTIFINSSPQILQSQDGGQTWESIGMGGKVLAVSPNYATDGILFAGTRNSTSGELYRSTDRGVTWTELSGFGPYDFFHTIALSPDFANDQTLVIGIDCRPLYISEDVGETWMELDGVPEPCGYRKSTDVVLTHKGQHFQPFVSIPSNNYQLFSYQWPKLETVPSRSVFRFELGDTLSKQQTIQLQSYEDIEKPWEVINNLNWLSVAPISGTLPSEIDLTVDPLALASNENTLITFEATWYKDQKTQYEHGVVVIFYTNQVFLPVLSR